MFMLLFIFVIVCGLFSGSEYVQDFFYNFFYIYIVDGGLVIKRGGLGSHSLV